MSIMYQRTNVQSSPCSCCSPVHTEEATQEEVVEEEGREVSLSRLEEEIQVRSEAAAPHVVRLCVMCVCSCRRREERVRRKKKEPCFWTSPDCSRPQSTRLAPPPDHHFLYYTTILALPPHPCHI